MEFGSLTSKFHKILYFTKVASIPEFENMKRILVYSGDNIESFKECRCVNYKDAGKIVGNL